MPRRNIALVNDHYYHIYNRTTNRQNSFNSPSDYNKALTSLWYYNFSDNKISLSALYQKMPVDFRDEYIKQLIESDNKYTSIIAYCLMPNHFHLVLKQRVENGISKFIGDFQNSYTRSFNKKHEHRGNLFDQRFKAKHIETDEQLLHITRYIHLNPITSSLIKSTEELITYPYSSYTQYCSDVVTLLMADQQDILDNYKSITNPHTDYAQFVEDQIDYQKELHKIKHLLFD